MANRDGIWKLGQQHYRICVELPRGADGRRNRCQRVIHGSRADAKAARDALKAELARGVSIGTADQTLSQYLTTWLAEKEIQVSGRTHARYTCLLMGSVVPALGHIRLRDLTSQHLSDYYRHALTTERTRRGELTEAEKELGGKLISPTTIHHRHVALKGALDDAVRRHRLIAFNPADMAIAPKRKRGELLMLDVPEVQHLLETLAGTSSDLLAFTALYTGARLGELLALRWRDLDADTQVLYIRRTLVEPLTGKGASPTWYSFKEPKSGKGRPIDLDAETVRRLKAHRKEQNEQRLALPAGAWHDLDLIFASAVGEPIRPSKASKAFSKTATAAGYDRLRFHDLRHIHATLLLKEGVAVHVVSRRLGHADVATTLRHYAEVIPAQARGAADTFASLMHAEKKAV